MTERDLEKTKSEFLDLFKRVDPRGSSSFDATFIEDFIKELNKEELWRHRPTNVAKGPQTSSLERFIYPEEGLLLKYYFKKDEYIPKGSLVLTIEREGRTTNYFTGTKKYFYSKFAIRDTWITEIVKKHGDFVQEGEVICRVDGNSFENYWEQINPEKEITKITNSFEQELEEIEKLFKPKSGKLKDYGQYFRRRKDVAYKWFWLEKENKDLEGLKRVLQKGLISNADFTRLKNKYSLRHKNIEQQEQKVEELKLNMQKKENGMETILGLTVTAVFLFILALFLFG